MTASSASLRATEAASPSSDALEPVWLDADSADINELERAIARRTSPADVPGAIDIVSDIPVYDGATVDRAADSEGTTRALCAEWHRVLGSGAGVFVVRGAWQREILAPVSRVFDRLIAEQEADSSAAAGDHFAASGSNARIWNAHEKLAVGGPEAYLDYAANPTLALAALAWLGPGYQVTAQVNLVRPGGAAQSPHRDYHMGFQSGEALARYPASMHRASACLTLQGGVAHVDVPLDSGPTQLLPFSQNWLPGYVASGRADVQEIFARARVQLPLALGDALFFNPALLHAAGENRTADVQRLVNLFQIGSAYGRAMERLDRARMVKAVYPALLAAVEAGSLDGRALARVIAATADGYAFPANLELEPPVDGMSPATQADLVHALLAERRDAAAAIDAIAAQAALKRSH